MAQNAFLKADIRKITRHISGKASRKSLRSALLELGRAELAIDRLKAEGKQIPVPAKDRSYHCSCEVQKLIDNLDKKEQVAMCQRIVKLSNRRSNVAEWASAIFEVAAFIHLISILATVWGTALLAYGATKSVKAAAVALVGALVTFVVAPATAACITDRTSDKTLRLLGNIDEATPDVTIHFSAGKIQC